MDGKTAKRGPAESRTACRLADRLASLQQAGVTHLHRAPAKKRAIGASASESPSRRSAPTPASLATLATGPTIAASPCATGSASAGPTSPVTGNQPAARPPAAVQVPPAERLPRLEIIRREVAACTRCTELATTRTQTVFGVGNINARLMFVGEAPGADEDRAGEPFVGKAGQLLTKIIEACRMKREDVYIGNVIKCRPPGNRNPLPDEVQNCRGYLERQLAIVRPEFICCLGAVAAKSLLNSEATIGRLRGRFYQYEGIPVLCTYHPAYLLRNPSAKRDVWEDMKLLMARMGIELG
ncbi:MAG TPA: uracil-DNA glycosylase family protein [Pirellulales bacterium]|nr:uracil-DNA glycosylase family protein [Pirellulales bacterium]